VEETAHHIVYQLHTQQPNIIKYRIHGPISTLIDSTKLANAWSHSVKMEIHVKVSLSQVLIGILVF